MYALLSEPFGRRLMNNAECYCLLHPSQHGAHKGKMSISTVLLKLLSYDVIRQRKWMHVCSTMMLQPATTT